MSLVNENIDINCDLGEIDPSLQLERKIMPLINRCNIAAGAHAGNDEMIKGTMLLAKEHGVKIGIHPSYPDKENFGRIRLEMEDSKLLESIKEQLVNFIKIAEQNHIAIDHVKAHGALYHYLAESQTFANDYLALINKTFPEVNLLVPPNSEVEKQASSYSIGILIEAFADRKYTKEGKLQSRSIKGSILSKPDEVVMQVDSIINKKGLMIGDAFVELKANSICVHSDTKNSVEILEAIKNRFQ